MSLFKLKHLWIQSFPQQEFDEKHLSIGKIDNQSALALASFSGKFYVYRINTKGQFKINLIYENKFEGPIVAVQFVDYPEERQRNCIGVLLQKKFVYVLMKANASGGYDTRHIPITIQQSFAIQPSTLSTMTLNSSIQYLNPLSKQPLKVSDPIYPFHRITDHLYYADGQQLVHVQNTTEQWRITVGPMRSIHSYHQFIVVVGDHALWEVQESKILKTKVMDEEISCGALVEKSVNGQNGYNIVVADFKNRIFVYTSQYRLIWAVKTLEVPVGIKIFEGQLQGAIAMIGEQGTASISYLGSQLPQTQLQLLNQEINMEQVDSQISKLMSQLKISQQNSESSPQQKTSQSAPVSSSSSLSISVRCSSPQIYSIPLDKPQQYFNNNNGEPWSCELYCQLLTNKQPIYDIVVSLEAPSNITCLDREKKIGILKDRERVKFVMLCSAEKFPYLEQVQVIVRYKDADTGNVSSILTQKCQLPLNFQCSLKSLQLQQKPTNKIVFKAHSDLPAFSQIFHEFGSSLENTKNLTVRLPNGVLCSMGYNKNNTKVKIESNFFSGLCFLFITFYHRFEKLVRQKKTSKNELGIDDIPLQQFFTLMKDHFNLRTSLHQKSENLSQKSQQFRNAQKKLLIKMKQKVSSINNIDKLLQYTYFNLIKSADQFEQVKDELQSVNHNLQISINFVLELLFMKTKANQKCKQKVFGIIGYERQSMEYGWEEKILSNSSFYLNKKFNYNVDKYTFDQLYKTALWVISKINSGDWNQ